MLFIGFQYIIINDILSVPKVTILLLHIKIHHLYVPKITFTVVYFYILFALLNPGILINIKGETALDK